MIEQRRLTERELNDFVTHAPDTEVRNLFTILSDLCMVPYEFFDTYAIDHFGLLSDGRPLYVAVLTQNEEGKKEFWTVVNSGVKQPFSLCKYCKRELKRWVDKQGDIFATMEKVSSQNRKWTEWLGFRKIEENSETITFKISKGE